MAAVSLVVRSRFLPAIPRLAAAHTAVGNASRRRLSSSARAFSREMPAASAAKPSLAFDAYVKEHGPTLQVEKLSGSAMAYYLLYGS